MFFVIFKTKQKKNKKNEHNKKEVLFVCFYVPILYVFFVLQKQIIDLNKNQKKFDRPHHDIGSFHDVIMTSPI